MQSSRKIVNDNLNLSSQQEELKEEKLEKPENLFTTLDDHIDLQNTASIPLSNTNFIRHHHELNIDDVMTDGDSTVAKTIIMSSLSDGDAEEQAARICEAFNTRAKETKNSCFTISNVRGERIEPGEFLLGHRNNIPEIIAYSKYFVARALDPRITVTTEIIKSVKQDSLYFGAHGSHVLNVPPGKYALAKGRQNNFLIYGPGPHVIHDNTFQFDMKNGLVDQSSLYIKHGPLHIVRVPPGKLAKVTINSAPCLLKSRKEPYVFIDPTFCFNTSDYMDQADNYIHHGTITIMRVPSGKVAKVWINNLPKLLESRAEPYVFDDPTVRLNGQNFENCLADASARLIVHGSLKRLMPHTSEDAITLNNGNLEIISASQNNKPILIESPTHSVEGFINKSIQTEIFPSKATTKKRLEDNPNMDKSDASWITARTSDSLGIKIQFLVAYKIIDPLRALQLLGQEGILPHIESLATADMTSAIQMHTSQQFLVSYQKKPSVHENSNLLSPNSAPVLRTCQEDVKIKLANELRDYGIEITRFNIESADFQDKKLAEEMAKQSLLSAETNARQSVLNQETIIRRTTAEQDAETKRIMQDQVNATIISRAESELREAELKAQATIVMAKADAEATKLSMEATAAGYANLAAVLEGNPALLQYMIVKELAAVLPKINNFNVTSQELGPFMMNPFANNPALLFSQSEDKKAMKAQEPSICNIKL